MFGGTNTENTGGWFLKSSTEFLLHRGINNDHAFFVMDD